MELGSTAKGGYLEEGEPVEEILHVAPERFQRRVGHLRPHFRYLSGEHAGDNLLEVERHYDQALYGLLHADQAVPDHLQQLVEPAHFLDEDRVHALRVRGGILFHHGVSVKIFREFRQNVRSDFLDYLVRRFGCALR